MIDTTKHTGLRPVDGFPFAVLASDGLAERARTIAERCQRAHRFLGDILDFRPAFALLVLGPADWGGRSTHPVYGVPNHAAGTLIVAGERNPFWQGFLDLIAAQRPDLLPGLRALYGLPDGTMDLSPFF